MPLRSEDDWKNYKDCLRESIVKCAEVIASVVPSTVVDEVVVSQIEPSGCGDLGITQEFDETLGLVQTLEAHPPLPVDAAPCLTTSNVAQEYSRLGSENVALAVARDEFDNRTLETMVNDNDDGPSNEPHPDEEDVETEESSSSSDSEEECEMNQVNDNDTGPSIEEVDVAVHVEENCQMNFEFVGGPGHSSGIN